MGLPKFWTMEDRRYAKEATCYRDLSAVGLRVLERTDRSDPYLPLTIVCGPISTGGLGSKEKNIARFSDTIAALKETGLKVFDQIPFEEHIWRIGALPGNNAESELLSGFYLPLFESGLIKMAYFIPSWESSGGASWEHGQMERLGIKTIHI